MHFPGYIYIFPLFLIKERVCATVKSQNQKQSETAEPLLGRKLLAGEIKLNTANRLIASSNSSTNTHIHSNKLHITYTEEGRGFCQMEDYLYKLLPGTIHFVYPNEAHKYYSDPKNPYKIYFLHFDWIGIAPELPRSILIKKAERKKIDEIFYSLFHFYHYFKAQSKTARILSLLFELFAEISDCMELADSGNIEKSGVDKDFFMDVLTKLQTPPFSFPGIDEMARQKKMSRRSFTRTFRQHTGMSVMEYFNEARMTYAQFLLNTSEYTIKEIACQCGYSNSQNMRRALQKRPQ